MIKTTLPVLILKGAILFPNSEIRLELDSDSDKELLSLAESCYDKHILIVNQIDPLEETPDVLELPNVGVLGLIVMKLGLPDGRTRVVIKGIKRVKIDEYSKEDGNLISSIEQVNDEQLEPLEEQAYARSLVKQLEIFVENVPYMSNSILSQVQNITDLNQLTDIIAIYLNLSYERKLELLEECNVTVRVKMLLDDINKELRVIELEKELEQEVSKNIEQAQKEFVLNEKLKVIKEELGETASKDDEVKELATRIEHLKCPVKIKERLNDELKRYQNIPPASPELGTIHNYMDWLLNLPWKVYTKDNTDLKKAKEILDNNHYGLDKIKDRIIEFLALRQRTKNSNSPIICFVGPPGVGKTTLAKSIAEATNRKWTKISVGGINDEAEIMGHRRTYIGAAPGKIIQGMKKVKTSNPVFIIDEIDKMTKDIKGDPASALLEILDKEQNKYFQDHYIEEEYDLSSVMFICTANYIEQIPTELLDRLEIINLNSYTEYEKLNIARDYLIRNSLIEHNFKENQIVFTDDAILNIIRNYTKEAGVRELKRNIDTIVRKIVKDVVISKKEKRNYIIEEKNIVDFLGQAKYLFNSHKEEYVGVVNAMSYTPFGGDILQIETAIYKGKNNIITTGSLGDVFKESIEIALSYIKNNYKNLKINYSKLEDIDIHIHVPEGAVKKDGPSAGIAITTALISNLTNTKIPTDISMTGEITLNGMILPIGGLKEKIIGAKRSNIKKIYLPKENQNDLDEIDDYIKEGLDLVLVDNYIEVYKDLFGENNG